MIQQSITLDPGDSMQVQDVTVCMMRGALYLNGDEEQHSLVNHGAIKLEGEWELVNPGKSTCRFYVV